MQIPTVSRRNLSSIASLANHDFCPWLNRYVYWLKEPVGWFVVATAVSVLVGAFLSPLGWTVAAGLVVILVLGLGFPWLATRSLHCELSPVQSELHEREASYLELRLRNRLPLPILGLMVEGYLTQPGGGDDESQSVNTPSADVGLARVPALSLATYRLEIQPEYRGRYPLRQPNIACAFPFGIWTARRLISKVTPVVVRPLLIPISGELEFSGKQMAEIGSGQRTTNHGDFLGVRAFRRGDSLKSIHWVQSARQDALIVCERGGPQQQAVDIRLSTAGCDGSWAEARENLAWRVRIAASLVDLLVARHLPFRLLLDGQVQALPEGVSGRSKAWERLADIPLDSPASSNRQMASDNTRNSTASCIDIPARLSDGGSLSAHQICIVVQHPSHSLRCQAHYQTGVLDLDEDIGLQLNQLLSEAARASQAA